MQEANLAEHGQPQNSGWTWSHIGGATFGLVQIGGGVALIVLSGGFAAQAAGPLMSSGFSGVSYSVTTNNFETTQYIKQCATGAATTLVTMGMGAGLSQVGGMLELGFEATTTAGKGALTVAQGASNAVQYQVATDFVESVKDQDITMKRVRENLAPTTVLKTATIGAASNLVSSGVGHFSSKKPKLDTGASGNNVGFFEASKGCLRTKQIAYLFRDKIGKQALKDISKSIDSALRSVSTQLIVSTGTSIASGDGISQPSGSQVFMSALNGAVNGGLDSRVFHQTKLFYKDQVANGIYLEQMLRELKSLDCDSSPEFKKLLADTMSKFDETKKTIAALEKHLQLDQTRLVKLQNEARNSRDNTRLINDQLGQLRELLNAEGRNNQPAATM